MELSVVVPTLNGRDHLPRCLDALREAVPDAEVVVVNGPSADGTTGLVRDRSDIDALVEVADRNPNVARNAGIAASTGEAVAFVGHDLAVESAWADAVREGLDRTDVVTGPTRRTMRVGTTTEREDTETVAGRTVTQFNGDNVALAREAVEALDGFDEHLRTGGARDGSHRLARLGYDVEWHPEMAVRREYGADGGHEVVDADPVATRHRSRAYRYVKSYGLRPTALGRVLGGALRECGEAGREVVAGDRPASSLAATVRGAVVGTLRGTGEGLRAVAGDRSARRNPNGVSSRYDRAVDSYDWR